MECCAFLLWLCSRMHGNVSFWIKPAPTMRGCWMFQHPWLQAEGGSGFRGSRPFGSRLPATDLDPRCSRALYARHWQLSPWDLLAPVGGCWMFQHPLLAPRVVLRDHPQSLCRARDQSDDRPSSHEAGLIWWGPRVSGLSPFLFWQVFLDEICQMSSPRSG